MGAVPVSPVPPSCETNWLSSDEPPTAEPEVGALESGSAEVAPDASASARSDANSGDRAADAAVEPVV
ncbi:MAG: hypothetical protein QOJ71_527, partial [Actinomycetota bacterium]|nr:hypothetical protein [Actinomycetota bacterium]